MSDPVARLNAALEGRYAIERELGEGGMATVYLADDLKHERKVALKVLKPELAAVVGAERFLAEIKVTAKLTHPHILPLHDSGEVDSFLFYVMPYIEGETLRDRIDREKQLPVDEAVALASKVAGALQHAHEHRVIHRDIKPSNILLQGGEPVVADFGIALALGAAGGSRITETGLSLGTPEYMSPEQATADHHLDFRSDIYSLGAVLYEMLTGEPPHTGRSTQAVIAKLLTQQPTSPRILRDTVSEVVDEAVMKALAKLPADRFSTATQFSDALTAPGLAVASLVPDSDGSRGHRFGVRRGPLAALAILVLVAGALGVGWAVFQSVDVDPTTVAEKVIVTPSGEVMALQSELTQEVVTLLEELPESDSRSVAVLYFEDLSPSDSLAFIADGLTESLIGSLSRVQNLDVISRNGVAPYRGSQVSHSAIARALDVSVIIAGTVEQTADSLRVTVQRLVDFTGTEAEPSARDAAWALVQRAERTRKDAEERVEEDDMAGATQLFERADSFLARAQTVDPTWIEPIVLQGQIAYRGSRLAPDPLSAVDWLDVGMGHAERALSQDQNHPEALELRGTLRYFRYLLYVTPDPTEAENLLEAAQEDLEAAVRGDSTLASAYSTLSHLYYQNQIEDGVVSALLAAERAYELDEYLSVTPAILSRLFFGSYDLERFTPARRWCAVGRNRFPENFRFTECGLWLMTIPEVEPDVADAWRLLDELTGLVPEPVRELQTRRAQMAVGGILARVGLADSARAVLVRARAGAQIDPAQELTFVEAFMRTLLGDHDEAIQLLKRFMAANGIEVESGEPGGEIYWWFRDLRDHPEFEDVRAVVG